MTALQPLWRRKLPFLAAASIFAVGNLVFFLTYRSGWQERRQSLEARRDELRRSAQTKEQEAEKLATQRQRLSGVSSAIEEFYGHRIGPERDTLAGVVGEVHAVLKNVGVSTPQISYATQPVPKLPLTSMRINFSAKCDYPRFKRLLRAFEQDRRWIAVRGIAITRDPEGSGIVTVQLELVTYFAESEGGGEESEPRRAAVPVRRAG